MYYMQICMLELTEAPLSPVRKPLVKAVALINKHARNGGRRGSCGAQLRCLLHAPSRPGLHNTLLFLGTK